MNTNFDKGKHMGRVSYTEEMKKQFIASLVETYGNSVTRKNIIEFAETKNYPFPHWLLTNSLYKSSRGNYLLTVTTTMPQSAVVTEEEAATEAVAAVVTPLKQKRMHTEIDNLIPAKDSTYVPFGFFRDMERIIQSRQFYPVFITGLSGNGKTTMVEQVCSKLNRECIRINVSIETDEDDLIGGNTLIDGNVVYREGPLLTAMKRGSIVILDEIDRGSNKLMCLQAILEGKPYFNKKTGDVVHPAAGFNIIATANTKGRGTEDGKFIAAQILDEAFLERFPITVEQEYPTPAVEKKIIILNMQMFDCIDEDFANKLVTWGEIIRKTFIDGGIDELISTRRLVHIVKAFSMFKDRLKAIELCINRFDGETKNAFMDLYTKMDAPPVVAKSPETPTD
jgi:hypothetical protein